MGPLHNIAQYSPYYLPLNVLLIPKDQTIIFYLIPISVSNAGIGAVFTKQTGGKIGCYM